MESVGNQQNDWFDKIYAFKFLPHAEALRGIRVYTRQEMSRVWVEGVLGGSVPGGSGGALGLQEIVLSVAQMMVG